MSSRAVLIAVVVALGLLVVAYLVTTGPGSGGASATEPILSFDPGALEAVTHTAPDGTVRRIQRTEQGGWMWSSGDASWPAIFPSRAQAAITTLANLTPSGEARRAESVPENSHTITIETADAEPRTLRFSADSLGGLALAQADDGPVVRIDTTVVQPFIDPGLDSWRINTALPDLFDASRISLSSEEAPIMLARTQGTWRIVSPISARAEPAAVQALKDSLSRITIQRFLPADSSTRSDRGTASPQMTISLERDQRSPDASADVPVRTTSWGLRIGDAANADGSVLYADPIPDRGLVFHVNAAGVRAVSTSPRNYLALTATGVLPADVFGVRIRNLDGVTTYRRELDDWKRITPDGVSERTESAPLERLLSFLAATPGEPEPARADDDLHTLARIELQNLAGERIDLLSAGYNADGVFAVREGSVLVLYPGQPAPDVLGLPPFDQMPAREVSAEIDAPDTIPSK